ncbi:MAG: hypothetical protein WKF82_11890 [Nocardioidaceae bacterium]
MTWQWSYQDASGSERTVDGPAPAFTTQSDAETWIGETWQDLADAGVMQVTLLEDGRRVYGPMSLSTE